MTDDRDDRGRFFDNFCLALALLNSLEKYWKANLKSEAQDYSGEGEDPFQDGNGRIARLITIFILIMEGLFPLSIGHPNLSK